MFKPYRENVAKDQAINNKQSKKRILEESEEEDEEVLEQTTSGKFFFLKFIFYFFNINKGNQYTAEEQAEYDRLTAPVEPFGQYQKRKQLEKLPVFEQFCTKWE